MNLDWATNPPWLIINALVAYRLTRLWVADMLPPLPRMRDAVQRWGERTATYHQVQARGKDNLDPIHRGKVAEDRERARQGGYNPPADIGPRETEALRVHRIYGGTHAIAYLVTCAWCSGYWISLAAFLAASLIPIAVWAFLAVPLAFSAVVGLLHQVTE